MGLNMMTTQLLILAFSWLAYFVIHSLLASIAMKQVVAARWPGMMAAYRVMFNVLAVLLLAPPMVLTFTWEGPWLWQWSGIGWWLSVGISVLALGGFLWSLKYYDVSEFLGTRQLSLGIRSVDDQEEFHLSPLHRWVRHPWYFFALLLIWAQNMHAAMLLSAVMISLYLVIGSRLEEGKLIRYHGERYRRYREQVPGLIPLPWRYLGKEQMHKLLK